MGREKTGWRNWGDHPLIVGIFAIAAIVGILAGLLTIYEYFVKNRKVPSITPTNTVIYTNSPTTTPPIILFPPSMPEKEIIKEVVLTYYNNIHNDRSENINPDLAWVVLTPFLQNKLGGKEIWKTLISTTSRYIYIIHPSDLDNYENIQIADPYSAVNLFLEIRDIKMNETYQVGNTITICLLREGGKWRINSINTTIISLTQCTYS